MKSTTARNLVILLLAALALRLAAGFWWQSRVGEGFYFPDSESYWSLGRAIAEGEPYEYGDAQSRVFRSPGYPILLAPLFLIGGEDPPIVWARVLGAMFGTLSVTGVWWLGRRLFNPTAGWIAGVAAGVYPGAIASSVFVLSEGPFCPLMLGNLGLWIAAWQAENTRRAGWLALAAGGVAGAAVLVRPSWLLFLPFAVLTGIFFARLDRSKKTSDSGVVFRPIRRHLGLGLMMTLGLVVVMMPWWIRNAGIFGRFVPTTLEIGTSLYDGLNPAATGGSEMSFVDRFIEPLRDSKGNLGELREIELDRRMREEALAWARSHPGRVIELAWRKFLRMWSIWPNEASFSSSWIRFPVMLIYVPLLLLGILGAAQTIRWGWPYWLCWLPAVYFTLLHVVFVGSIRYREPAMLGLIVLAAGLVAAVGPTLGRLLKAPEITG